MKVLVIGGGGREHALCWKLSQSKDVEKIYCAPGNGGSLEFASNVDIEANDIESLLNFAKEEDIDLTIVGPEEPLTLGITDRFIEEGLKIFGPDKKASQLEASKEFSKKFMDKYDIPTAGYKTFTDLDKAKMSLDSFSYPLVIKADGLCLGKGVFICQTKEDAEVVLKDILEERCFGDEGAKIIIEEFLEGVEVSLLCFVCGNKIIAMESAKDHKKIEEGEKGLNTGGIGAFSPSNIMNADLKLKIEREILKKISHGLKEEDLEYKGILFIGFMIHDDDIKVLEFNVRFGDPETQSVLLRLESDLAQNILDCIDGNLKEQDLVWNNMSSVCVVTTSLGYPLEYEKHFEIEGLDALDSSIVVFHNGSKYIDGKLLTNGGRVLTVSALGEDIRSAREKIYREIEKISYKNIYYRKDIGNC
nr:phosphoribosylamine--glycine ligase [Tissierella sp.]